MNSLIPARGREFIFDTIPRLQARIAQSVWRLIMGQTAWVSNPGGGRFSTPIQIGPGAHPASYKMGTGSAPGV